MAELAPFKGDPSIPLFPGDLGQVTLRAFRLAVFASQRKGREVVHLQSEFRRQPQPADLSVAASAGLAEFGLMNWLVTINTPFAHGGRLQLPPVMALLTFHGPMAP